MVCLEDPAQRALVEAGQPRHVIKRLPCLSHGPLNFSEVIRHEMYLYDLS